MGCWGMLSQENGGGLGLSRTNQVGKLVLSGSSLVTKKICWNSVQMKEKAHGCCVIPYASLDDFQYMQLLEELLYIS